MKEPLQSALPRTANATQQKSAVNPLQLLLHKNIAENPFQQLKKETALQPVFNPLQLLAKNSMPVQLAKLPYLDRNGPGHYVSAHASCTNPSFTSNHRVDSASDFTIAEAKKRGLARGGERKNSIVKMNKSELIKELKKIIKDDVDNDDYMNSNEMTGNTSQAYPWITSVKNGAKPMKFEGGECILTLGLSKVTGSTLHLWISHLDSGPLDNDPAWIANKVQEDATAEAAAEAARVAEAARLAAEAEAAREAEEEDDNEEEAPVAETPEQEARRKARNKKKNQRKKAKAAAAKATVALT